MIPDASMLNIEFLTDLVISGFWAGSLIGLIIGAITWAVTEKGTSIIFIMSIAFLIGLIVGIYIEGSALLQLLSAGRDAVLESSDVVRRTVFGSLVGIVRWVFAFLALGAAVGSLKRAFTGALIGVVVGTVLGMVLILLGSRLALSPSNPLADVLIGVTAVLIMTLMALNQTDS